MQPNKAPGSQVVRLVTVTHFFPSHGGGLEKVAEKVVQGLAQLGYQICWFSSDTDPAPLPVGPHVATIPVPTSNFIERFTQLPYPLWSPGVLPKLWREIGKADAVHVHEHLYLPSIVAIVMARLRRRPVVITQHMGALRLGSRLSTALYESGARFLGWILFPLASRAVFISANVRRFFRRDGSRRALLIFNGVDTRAFALGSQAERASVRRRLGLRSDGAIVLFVGRFVRKKGLHRVMALAARFQNVQWVLVGSGPEAPRSPAANVLVAGRVEHEHLADYYRAADLLILPSAGEGMPLVVQEALCCGAAILSTDEVASACPEAAEMIRTQPVPREGDGVEGWENALRAILADSAYLQERQERARRAHALWSWDRCVAEYSGVFREILEVS